MKSLKNIEISVPDRYFECLEERLMKIPAECASTKSRKTAVVRVTASAAAVLLILVTAGTAVFRLTSGRDSIDNDMATYDMIRLADLVPITDPYFAFSDDNTEEAITQEDLSTYLINSGTSLEHIEYYEDNK